MLKKTWILFLGLVVCAGSACVTPTHASSASNVILVHVQAASPASAKDEMVTIYNNSSAAIDISNWCLANKAAVKFVCFNPPIATLAYYLAPYTHAVIASESFVANSSGTVLPENVSFIYAVTNQSSGSLVNSNDTISLINNDGLTVDSYSWASAIPAGKIANRSKSLVNPSQYETANLLADWFYEPLSGLPTGSVEIVDSFVDPTPPDPEEPSGGVVDPPFSPTGPLKQAVITEILANPRGSDTGTEYIELYNPNPDSAIDLSNYKLRVGPQLEKSYSFASTTTLLPLEYIAFTNAEIKFTLLNSSSAVQLEYNGILVDEAIVYMDPPEGFAYALFEEAWYYTATPTPNASNGITASLAVTGDTEQDETNDSLSTLKPCAIHQYRSPETNRCRNIVTTTASSLTPCAVNQYRSPETNRCRNISSTSSDLTPCKAGQERNPETNRCRNSIAMTNADHSVKNATAQGYSTGANWYWWLAIGGVFALVIAYALWEWREEISKVWKMGIRKFARNPK